jgi:hypothetical protein
VCLCTNMHWTTNCYCYCNMLRVPCIHTLYSGLLPASELQTFSAPVWRDKLLPTTPNSKLHPSVTGAESLIRWTGTPLWITGPDSAGMPDGAYITGDIVNGKTRIPELASAIIG